MMMKVLLGVGAGVFLLAMIGLARAQTCPCPPDDLGLYEPANHVQNPFAYTAQANACAIDSTLVPVAPVSTNAQFCVSDPKLGGGEYQITGGPLFAVGEGGTLNDASCFKIAHVRPPTLNLNFGFMDGCDTHQFRLSQPFFYCTMSGGQTFVDYKVKNSGHGTVLPEADAFIGILHSVTVVPCM